MSNIRLTSTSVLSLVALLVVASAAQQPTDARRSPTNISEKVKTQRKKSEAEVKAAMKKARAKIPLQNQFEERNPEQHQLPAELPKVPPPDPQEAWVPDGYRAEVVARNLTYPTSVEFDGAGTMYVAEAGYSYGDPQGQARVLRYPIGRDREVFVKGLNGPVTDLLWFRDRLYISHRGKISAWTTDGVEDFVTGLPSEGDHHNNQIVQGPDNRLYFGQGTVTNSGVVGPDNEKMGWLPKHPETHDIPAHDIPLTDQTFPSPGLLAEAKTAKPNQVKTSAFHPFGKTGKMAPGATKANGTILRMNLDGSGLEVYAWGLRNPFGLAWTPDGKLFASDDGFDERGSRPIANAPDVVWRINQGSWYGWPDYAGGKPVTDPRFQSERGPMPKFLMKEHPPITQPITTLEAHSGAAKMAVSRPGTGFGFDGHLFLALFGDLKPMTGTESKKGGFKVVHIDPRTGQAHDFFHEKSEGKLPIEVLFTKGPRRPIDVKFSPRGDALYIVDFGVVVVRETAEGPKPQPMPGTGAVWKITRKGSSPRPLGGEPKK